MQLYDTPKLRFSDHIPVQLKKANWTKEKKPNKEKLWIEQLTGSGAQATKFGRWNEAKAQAREKESALIFFYIYFSFFLFFLSFCDATHLFIYLFIFFKSSCRFYSVSLYFLLILQISFFTLPNCINWMKS